MYKLKQELPKKFKIKVNPKQSEVLQKHLFSIGKKWKGESRLEFTDKPYLYCSNHNNLGYGEKSKVFNQYELERIKFKDYFEKVDSFTEKWCILVTEDNYQELKTWMYRNVGNYLGFKDGWFTHKGMSIGKIFYSHGSYSWNSGYENEFYELITSEQFRAKYGDLKPKNEGYTDKTIKEEYEEHKQLRFENEHLKEENDKLKHKILMLTEKLETIKKVIE